MGWRVGEKSGVGRGVTVDPSHPMGQRILRWVGKWGHVERPSASGNGYGASLRDGIGGRARADRREGSGGYTRCSRRYCRRNRRVRVRVRVEVR